MLICTVVGEDRKVPLAVIPQTISDNLTVPSQYSF